MRKFLPILALLAIMGSAGTSRALDLTLDSPSVNAGSQVTVNVIWSSTTALKYLSTEFIITAVGGAPTGEVTFANTPIDATTGTPAMPDLNAANYVFSGDSDDFITLSGNNPASVFTTPPIPVMTTPRTAPGSGPSSPSTPPAWPLVNTRSRLATVSSTPPHWPAKHRPSAAA